MNCNIEIVKLLLKSEANYRLKTKEDKTALDLGTFFKI